MNQNLLKLAKRRANLVKKAEAQRLAVSQSLDVWRKPLSVADHGLNVLRYLRRHPFMMAGGGTALLSIFRPNGFGKWVQRGWLAWQILRKLNGKSKP